MNENQDFLLPDNEQQRLAAVRYQSILDTLPEFEFDTLARVAAGAMNMPMAVIGLMDADRLWFKAKVGLEVPQLDRQIAFCSYAILRPNELLEVQDLSEDERFRYSPLVADSPRLRFYAGAPLVDPMGFALGTLAVIDTQPRSLNDMQRDLLKDLAALVVLALEKRLNELKLGEMALTDYLTGLANRVEFDRVLKAEMAHTRRTGEQFTVFYMDLNGFKAINDFYGHVAGDEVLKDVASRMQEQVRTEDLLARLGGDEFAVLMRQDFYESSHTLKQRIIDAMAPPVMLSNGELVQVSIAVGSATYTDASESITDLLCRADKSLYEVKRGN